jgi:hypothetical protein
MVIMTDTETVSICSAFPVTAHFYRSTDDRVEREANHRGASHNRWAPLNKAALVAKAKDLKPNAVNSQTSKTEALQIIVQAEWESSDLAALYKREEQACSEELRLFFVTVEQVREISARYRRELDGLIREATNHRQYVSKGRIEWNGLVRNYALPADEQREALSVVFRAYVPLATRGSKTLTDFFLGLLNTDTWAVYGVRSFISELLVPELAAIKAGTSDAVDDEVSESSDLAEFTV